MARLWREQCDLGLSQAGFIVRLDLPHIDIFLTLLSSRLGQAPIVLRAFPFITDLPVASIQAQGAIKLRIRELAQELAKEEIAKANDPNAAPIVSSGRGGKERDTNFLSNLGE